MSIRSSAVGRSGLAIFPSSGWKMHRLIIARAGQKATGKIPGKIPELSLTPGIIPVIFVCVLNALAL
jgi:hypothetical protein